MSQPSLPIDMPTGEKQVAPGRVRPEEARLRRAVRNQVEMMPRDLDSLIAVDHAVRALWDFGDMLDLSAFYGSIKAVVERPGRQRLETASAKRLYKLRGATAEWANAQTRAHGLLPFTVRGLDKVLSVPLLVVIAHNLLRWLAWGA